MQVKEIEAYNSYLAAIKASQPEEDWEKEKVKLSKPKISVHMLSKEASLDRSLKLLSDLSVLPRTSTFEF